MTDTLSELQQKWTPRQALALLLLVAKADSITINSGDREPGNNYSMSEQEIADALTPLVSLSAKQQREIESLGKVLKYRNEQLEAQRVILQNREAEAKEQQREIERLKAEAEQLRVQLAGCGVAALSNTRKSMAEQEVKPGGYGYSASYGDVLRAVTREIEWRERAEAAEQRLAALQAAVAVECTCRVIEKCERCEAIDGRTEQEPR